ncbi:dynamin family protein [Thiolapillus sp.]
MTDQNIINNRLKHLETHLEQENPVLLSAVRSFRDLDRVAYRMGLLDRTESFATQIPWWPLISILGTFSAGKSTFINNYLGVQLQRSGNQAVDDRFTVICYSEDPTPHTLPGVALDSDPRFPFYKISREIELVAEGEGNRIDAYLQLKSCNSERLKGKILIDSPGFDADAQRTSTLRITDHMVDLSDLVLVFFDARHPEPGAMRDTLEHLVSKTIHRNDSGKFLYILNQIDTTANEDNPEEVIAAWQRALGEHGLTAGRFFTIYSPTASVQIEDATLRQRYEGKRDRDLAEIYGRMEQVEVERAYRIVGSLEKTAREIEEFVVPALHKAVSRWKKRTLWLDSLVFGALAIVFLGFSISSGQWQGLHYTADWWQWVRETTTHSAIFLAAVLGVGAAIHLALRELAARSLSGWLKKEQESLPVKVNLLQAFRKNIRPWRSLLHKKHAGWNRRTRRMLATIINQADDYVQQLNDRFTNPSGDQATGGFTPAAPTSAEGQLPKENEHAINDEGRTN